MTPLERRAWFAYWVVMRETSMNDAARKFGVSYNHLILVLKGERMANPELQKKISRFIKRECKDVFKPV